MPGLIIGTMCNGWYDMMGDQMDAVDAFAPENFRHIVMDDFSSAADGEKIAARAGPVERDGAPVGTRQYVHMRSLGATEAPNITRGFQHVMMECHRDPECAALFLLAYNCVINAETIPALVIEQAATPDTVLSCVQSVDGETIQWFGGQDGSKMGLHRGQPLSVLQEAGPSHAHMPWCHSATMWLPKHVLDNHKVRPDLSFRLYYADLDLCESIKRAGYAVAVVRRAWVHRVARGTCTSAFYGGETARKVANKTAYAKFRSKWHI